MKIALSGYGRMGRVIEQAAVEMGEEIFARIDPQAEGADFALVSSESVAEADVVIDFSVPASAVSNIKICCDLGKNIVVGTTGWYDEISHIRAAVSRSGIGFVYASNFSIGVHTFFRIVDEASRMMDVLDEYDVAVLETHHNRKVDSPSGTAKTLSEILLRSMSRKTQADFDRMNRSVEAETLHVASLRLGSMPGTHQVMFDSAADTIELRHQARNREGFARGAIRAARWIGGKQGFFTVDDLINDLLLTKTL